MKNRLLANKENQPPSQQSQSPAPKEPQNAKWTSEDDATFVDKLKEAQMEGNQLNNNFKKSAFVAVAVVLPTLGNIKGYVPCCSAAPRAASFGWDNTRKKVTAEKDVWDNYIASHPEAKLWCTNPFPFYDNIIGLIDGHYATGEGAFHIPEIDEPSLPSPHPYKEQVDQDDVGTVDGHPESDLDLDGEEKSQDSIEVSQSSKHKCAASGSPTPASASKRLCTKVTGPSAILGIADALSAMASSLSRPDPSISQLINDVPSIPKRRIAAIKAVCVDDALSTAKRTQAIALFTKNIAIADAYSAISDDVL
ncbi:hypothetical protein SERLADRAFT_432375 [Serpula lacrymans var. lacrymans S7.9]|uniref:Myb/SANT-like domain-containing protein n=1 Tax=Serpula lacrymans var. lacrymans (strain S7.9) TaxID=578457 RepID=F8ND08_SERL9|nr:uncharacterized protein SERLADRAFT_432375 [Serpula lacrymans var. lacrymans S7.9]EGO30752.1 hypothetical protein SERLADRAFT_432375 [Serpula lacrymans var. lacrymans S7.9]